MLLTLGMFGKRSSYICGEVVMLITRGMFGKRREEGGRTAPDQEAGVH